MKYFTLIIFSFFTFISPQMAYAQSDDINKNVIKWRRHLHQNPELSFKEKNTSDYIVAELKKIGNIEIVRPTPTSVIGILKGAKKGKSVGFRADIDALPVNEETNLPFASIVPGVSQACGHDAHAAMLLGTAKTLSKMKETLAGTVYFIFQHAEEVPPGGAIDIVKSGALKGVDAIFGLHVIPNIPAGTIGILPNGPASTNADLVNVTINGKGTHGSMPQLGIDPVVVASNIVMSLQTIVSRSIAPGEMTVVSIGRFQAGSANNVIPGTAEFGASIRTTKAETRALVADRIKTIVNDVAHSYGATADIDYIYGYTAIENSKELNDIVRTAAIEALGKDNVKDFPSLSVSEDFSFFKEVAPICYFILGVGDGPANHSSAFNIDESALMPGVKAQVQIIKNFLNGTSIKN